VASALAVLDVRAAKGDSRSVSAVNFSLVLGASSHLGTQPPPRFLEAAYGLASVAPRADGSIRKASRDTWGNFDVIRTVGLLNSLVRLGVTPRETTLWRWVAVLFRPLAISLEEHVSSSVELVGPGQRMGVQAGDQDWNMRNLCVAFRATCLLWGGCSSADCAVFGDLSRRCITLLVERISRLQYHNASKSLTMDADSARQTVQALLVLFHIRRHGVAETDIAGLMLLNRLSESAEHVLQPARAFANSNQVIAHRDPRSSSAPLPVTEAPYSPYLEEADLLQEEREDILALAVLTGSSGRSPAAVTHQRLFDVYGFASLLPV